MQKKIESETVNKRFYALNLLAEVVNDVLLRFDHEIFFDEILLAARTSFGRRKYFSIGSFERHQRLDYIA